MKKIFKNIINELQKCKEKNSRLEGDYAIGRLQAYTKAIDVVQKAEKQYNNGWIPCSDRLPNAKELDKAYCRNIYGSEFIVMIEGATRPTTLKYTRDGFWLDQNSKIYDVVAWQMLPDPYIENTAV